MARARDAGASVHEQPDQNQHEGRDAEKPRDDVRHGFPPVYL